MHSLDHPAEELANSFRMAYDVTLRPYHSFIVRPIFNASNLFFFFLKDTVKLTFVIVGNECMSLAKRFLSTYWDPR